MRTAARTVILLDTNVLIYASSPESDFHDWAVSTIAGSVAADGCAVDSVSLAVITNDQGEHLVDTAHAPITAPAGFRIDDAATDLGSDLVHGKVLFVAEYGSLKAGVVDGRIGIDSGLSSTDPVTKAGVTVNVRAAVAPASIDAIVGQLIDGLCDRIGALVSDYMHRAIVPGMPEPEHRIRKNDGSL